MMSSSSFPIRVKKEEPLEDPPSDDISHDASSDSETENNIDFERLQPIDSKFASQWKFPIGCMVWYDARKSNASKIVRAKSGTVLGIFLNLEDMQKVYKVKSDTPDDDEHNEIALYEDRLVYGMNCPVKMTNPDTNKEDIDGFIVCPQLEDQNKVSYVVKFSEGKHVKMEFSVANERVKYREVVDETNSESMDQNKSGGEKDEKEAATSTTVGDAAVAAKKQPKNTDLASQEQKSASEKEAIENEKEETKQPAAISTISAEISNTRTENMADVAPNGYAKLAGGALLTMKEQELGVGLPLSSERKMASRWNPPSAEKNLQKKRSNELIEVGRSNSLERRTSSSLGLEPEERPKKKMAKTEVDEAEKPGNNLVTCTLTIPSWVYHINEGKKYDLFYHLLGRNDDGFGYKHKIMVSKSGCNICISGKDEPMKIDIHSSSPQNVAKGISMVEESLIDFISDENSSTRMLYELMWTAEGSYRVKKHDSCNMVYRELNGVQSWSALFDLPYKVRKGGHREYHGKFFRLDLQLSGDCTIELFGDDFDVPLAHASPFVLIRGTKHKDVKDAVLLVRDKMTRHQDRGCGCTPRW